MEYQWIKSNRKTVAIQITEDGKLVVRSPYHASQKGIEKFLEEKYTWIMKHQARALEAMDRKRELTSKQRSEGIEYARKIFPERIGYYARIMGVTYERVTLREQKTRWGSCSAKGNLNFNWKLALMPLELLDYVVVHELAHRIEMNHSERFWKIVEEVLPDYKERRKKLKTWVWT